MLVANIFEPGDNGVTVQPLIVFGFPSNLTVHSVQNLLTDLSDLGLRGVY